MIDVGFAGYPYLAFVCLCAKQVGIIYLLDLVLAKIGSDQITQV